MTKFIDKTKNKTVKNETIFTHVVKIDSIYELDDCDDSPDEYDIVEFIGNDEGYGDVFKCRDLDDPGFTLFFGKKGNEFD